MTRRGGHYRILTPRFSALPVLHGDFFRPDNYPFSTPRKQTTGFRKQGA
jgi:hypothetical protein